MTVRSPPITVSLPHQLGRAEARRRIESGLENIVHAVPGGSVGHCTQRWDGDRLSFSLAVMGQAVSGVIDVRDADVLMELHLPNLVNYEFTAKMEEGLDEISRQESEAVTYLKNFYFGNEQPGENQHPGLKQQLEVKLLEVDPRDLSRFSLGKPENGPFPETCTAVRCAARARTF